MERLKVQLSNENSLKIGDGIIIKEEKTAVYVEMDNPDLPKDSIYVGSTVKMKIFGDIDGLKIYQGIITYRLGGLVALSNLSLLVSVQRRKDLKIKINENLIMTCISRNPEIVINAEVLDISAGGMGFGLAANKKEFEEEEIFETVFDLARSPFFLKMKILRVSEHPLGGRLYGCQFIELNVEEEQILREYVFKKQLTSRKRLERKLY